MDMRAPRIGWPFHPALNSAPTLLLMSTDAPLIWHRRAYRRRWAIDRARAALGRGPGRCTEAPDTSPPPRARYTPRMRSASVQVPCCVAHEKLPKNAAPSPPACGVRSAPVRVSRGAHADRAAPMGVPSARAGGERANAPLSCRHPVTAPAWGGRTAQKGGVPSPWPDCISTLVVRI